MRCTCLHRINSKIPCICDDQDLIRALRGDRIREWLERDEELEDDEEGS